MGILRSLAFEEVGLEVGAVADVVTEGVGRIAAVVVVVVLAVVLEPGAVAA